MWIYYVHIYVCVGEGQKDSIIKHNNWRILYNEQFAYLNDFFSKNIISSIERINFPPLFIQNGVFTYLIFITAKHNTVIKLFPYIKMKKIIFFLICKDMSFHYFIMLI